MRVVLTRQARVELTDAVTWYDARIRETAERFIDEFASLVSRLSRNPWQFPVIQGDVRRAGFRRFPYGLFFRVGRDRVEVLACFHASRNPRRWD